jgi:DNA-binding CsgD family transcriptional regulator
VPRRPWNDSPHRTALRTVTLAAAGALAGVLTDREVEVLRWMARGLSNQQVARAIGRTSETVKIHLRNIYAKLGADDRTGAVTIALARGLIHID